MRFRRRVAVPAATLDQALEYMRRHPQETAVVSDFDGVLAPIVARDQIARMPDDVRSSLRRIQANYRLTAVITGRRARNAQQVVGVRGIHIVGSFGSETLRSGHGVVLISPPFLLWRRRVRQFALHEWNGNLRSAGAILEDKGSVIVFHWRGAANEDATRIAIEAAADRARRAGFGINRGKKAIEFGPPVLTNKGTAVRNLLRRHPEIRCAIFFGDDTVDIPAMNALEELVNEGKLDFAIRVAVASDETPNSVLQAANHVVQGTDGVAAVLRRIASPLQQ